MLKVQLASEMLVSSEADGTAKEYRLPNIPQVLNAKSLSLYLLVQNEDEDTQLRVSWAHGPDGNNFVSESTYLYDSGDSEGVKTGMQASSAATDVTRVDIIAPALEILLRSGGTGTGKSAKVSVWAILKPF